MLSWLYALPAGWFIRLAILRLTAQWRSILTIIVGVLLAAIIGASVPLYTAAIAQVGMVQRLDQRPPADVQVYARANLPADIASGFGETRAELDAAVDDTVATAFAAYGDWRTRTVNWGETTTLLPVRDGEDIPDARLRVAYYDALQAEVEILTGTWPADPTSDDVDLQIALTDRVAETLGLSVGDTIVLDQRGWDSSRLITTQITALIRPRDLDSPYFAAPSPLRNDASGQWRVDANAFTTSASFDRINADFIPETRAQIGWRAQLDHNSLDFAQSQAAISTINGLDTAIEDALGNVLGEDAPTLVFTTELGDVLSSYRGEVDQLNAPFSLLLLQLGALVLFFLVVMGALVRRGERREIAMLQSRGAPDWQILLLRGVETAIICVLATLAAPFIARQLLTLLVPLFTNLNNLVLSIQPVAYAYAGVAAFVALLALTAALIPMLRVPLVQAGGIGSRSGDQTWWQRYYLDVVILIIGGAALWRLVSQDTVLAEDASGNTQSDPLLLLAPTLLVFALGSVLLRLFPLVMSALSRYFSTGRRAVEWTLSSWQVSREPLHYGRITFLLALAISIGWFAVSFQNTVVASQSDQARYATGADLRLSYDVADGPTVPAPSAFTALDEVQAATVLTRLENVPMSLDLGLDEGTLLGVDSAVFPQVAYWRDDLGPIQLSEEAGDAVERGLPLPESTQTLEINPLLISLDGDRDFLTIMGEFGPQPQILALGEIELFAQVRDSVTGLQLIPLVPDNAAFNEAILQRATADAAETDRDPPSNLPTAIRRLFRAQLIEIAAEVYPDGTVPLQADLSGLSDARFEGFVIEARHPNAQSQFTIRAFEVSAYLVVDALTIIDAEGETSALGWVGRDDWGSQIERDITLAVQLPEDEEPPEAALNEDALVLEWFQTRQSGIFRVLVNAPDATFDDDASTDPDDESFVGDRVPDPLPAFVSRSFVAVNEVEAGQQFNLFLDNTEIWFEIIDVIDYYPTLYNDAELFLVTEQSLLTDRLSVLPSRTIYPNEIWLDTTTDTQSVLNALGTEQNATSIRESFRLEAARDDLETDPLAVGLIGLLFFSFLVGITLSVVSLVTYATLTVQARRTELSVLRAIGLSPARITSSIAIEQTLVMLTAILLGLVIGFMLSTQVLPALSTNTAGADVTPPFLVELDPLALAQYMLAISLILVVALAFSATLVRRLTNAQALRQVEV